MLNDALPKICKAKNIYGQTLVFRDVNDVDAEFILSVRRDPIKSMHLNQTSENLEEQKMWIKKYNTDNTQAYFIILYKELPIGTVRLYDPNGLSFCWGSWILTQKAPIHAGIESALMVYSYAISHLGFENSHFDVRKENVSVCKFHERFGAEKINESCKNLYYSITKNSILNAMKRYKKYLGNGILIN